MSLLTCDFGLGKRVQLLLEDFCPSSDLIIPVLRAAVQPGEELPVVLGREDGVALVVQGELVLFAVAATAAARHLDHLLADLINELIYYQINSLLSIAFSSDLEAEGLRQLGAADQGPRHARRHAVPPEPRPLVRLGAARQRVQALNKICTK